MAFGVIIVACEVGQRISNAFENIDFATDQYRWYLFPEQVKRMLPVILMNLQVPVELPIFGSFCCDRSAFKQVSMNLNSEQNPTYINLIFDSDDDLGDKDWILIFYGASQIQLSFQLKTNGNKSHHNHQHPQS